MKIAVSGSHCSGKTTLVEALSRALPTHQVVDEPYYQLEEEGHQFAEMPSLVDFELQLDRSIQCIVSSSRHSLIERCPVDFLAYISVHRDFKQFDVATWLPRVQNAVEKLDLIVFVPVENPDRILVPRAAHPGLRRRVDEQLRRFLFDDPWDLQVRVLEVTGTPDERARRVLAHLGDTGN